MPQDEQLHDVFIDSDKSKLHESTKEAEDKTVGPWLRLGARTVDNIIFVWILVTLLVLFTPAFADEINEVIFGFVVLFMWVFVETLLLITLGTTFGKWLLKIQITTSDNKKPMFLHSFKRSLKVWFFGLAMGIPFVDIFTLISAYSDLTKRGMTSWDKSEKFIITHGEVSLLRIIIVWVIIGVSILPFFL
ncbi:RDD family protein [Legionella brunensis]|uniref:RDD family protein n=1 Tax=Legionella brunensis TaxID=29422 RepID=A0A0W0SKF8_9GAMM|nr:RDD family protein [Legionella brunensis]KTC83806.1 RDD family protein [Legionella brunensis]